MKIVRLISILLFSVGFIICAQAQITNLKVNGASYNFTMMSGGTLTWEMNVPTGSTVTGEIWYDVNKNGTIDPGTDIEYITFTETDGDSVGYYGPSDMDGLKNGHIIFSTKAGVAPGSYIFRFTQSGAIALIIGTVTPLTPVAHSFSGRVTPPSGHSAQNVLIDASPSGSDQGGTFWDAVTDANGNYTIDMDADTAGNPWIVSVGGSDRGDQNPFLPYLATPAQYSVTVTQASYTGLDFTFSAPAAQVNGYLKDEFGHPLSGNDVTLGCNSTYYDVTTDSAGYFLFALRTSDLDAGTWQVWESYDDDMSSSPDVMPSAYIGAIIAGDILTENLTAYTNNSTITGTVTIDGGVPGSSFKIFASTETNRAFGTCDANTGAFTIPVSNKLPTYILSANDPPGTYGPEDEVDANAGQTGVTLALLSSGPPSIMSYALADKWNLISVPQYPDDPSVTALFPTAQSHAFAYEGSYVVADSLLPGMAYWLKFSGAQNVQVSGMEISTNAIDMASGWNLFGAVSAPIPISTIIQIPDSMVQTHFFGYNNGYFSADTLLPGQGYWVKTNTSGMFIFDNGGGTSKKAHAKAESLRIALRERKIQSQQRKAARSAWFGKALRVK